MLTLNYKDDERKQKNESDTATGALLENQFPKVLEVLSIQSGGVQGIQNY